MITSLLMIECSFSKRRDLMGTPGLLCLFCGRAYLAGISQKKLYTKAYLGTKFKIQEYILEVSDCLNYLNESINSEPEDDFIMNSKQHKINFFHDARQSFGCTALILLGGSLFGSCHLGVVRALYF